MSVSSYKLCILILLLYHSIYLMMQHIHIAKSREQGLITKIYIAKHTNLILFKTALYYSTLVIKLLTD